jgi:hypothetical protein
MGNRAHQSSLFNTLESNDRRSPTAFAPSHAQQIIHITRINLHQAVTGIDRSEEIVTTGENRVVAPIVGAFVTQSYIPLSH